MKSIMIIASLLLSVVSVASDVEVMNPPKKFIQRHISLLESELQSEKPNCRPVMEQISREIFGHHQNRHIPRLNAETKGMLISNLNYPIVACTLRYGNLANDPDRSRMLLEIALNYYESIE